MALKKKKRKKKLKFSQIIKWFLIGLASAILIIGIIARVHHFYNFHLK